MTPVSGPACPRGRDYGCSPAAPAGLPFSRRRHGPPFASELVDKLGHVSELLCQGGLVITGQVERLRSSERYSRQRGILGPDRQFRSIQIRPCQLDGCGVVAEPRQTAFERLECEGLVPVRIPKARRHVDDLRQSFGLLR